MISEANDWLDRFNQPEDKANESAFDQEGLTVSQKNPPEATGRYYPSGTYEEIGSAAWWGKIEENKLGCRLRQEMCPY